MALSHQKDKISFKNPISGKEVIKDRKTVPFHIALNKWTKKNKQIEFWLKITRNQQSTLKIKFEDFTNNPNVIAHQLEQFLGMKFTKLENFIYFGEHPNHIIGGNSSRFNSKEIISSKGWDKKLSQEQKKIYEKSIAVALNNKYGYY